jgi:hypothetical protein
MKGLTREDAVALCNKVQEQNSAVLSTPGRLQCWQCQRESQGDPDRMYVARKPGYLGCDLVNRLRARVERALSL